MPGTRWCLPAPIDRVSTDRVLTDPAPTDRVLTDPVLTGWALVDPVLAGRVPGERVLTGRTTRTPVHAAAPPSRTRGSSRR